MTKSKSPEKQAGKESKNPSDLYPVDIKLSTFKTVIGKKTQVEHVGDLTCNLNFQCLFLPIPDKNLDLRYEEIENYSLKDGFLEISMKKEFRDLNGIYSVVVEGQDSEIDKIVKVFEYKNLIKIE